MTTALTLRYPDELPVSREAAVLRSAIASHPVVIVCGDTGSGKTTQLPKLIAEVLGGTPGGKIGVTQPRRLAATRMAARVAEECGVELGREVGVRVRFDDRTSDVTRIQFMTDGLLLAQLPSDPDWREYRAILVDEAHERSLNIDFILGCLRNLLPRRPDLKVVLSSATLDAQRFSDFFGGAPVVRVEGRLFPIRDDFLPLADRDLSLPDRVLEGLRRLDQLEPGLDTLVFLPGEREIRDTAKKLSGAYPQNAEILPLFARLGKADQDRAFRPAGRRRIVLATNVAETSVTIPGIRAVIDTGEVRLQRFHPQTGIQRLVTEPVSRASASQRRGRCGRTGPGVCVRLYAEEDLEKAPPYSDPEIRRSSLAGVMLRMAVLGLPPLNKFPLMDTPKGAAIHQGGRTLMDIGAMSDKRRVTPRGRRLARFHLDPPLARMLEEGHAEQVLPAVLVAVAFLSIQDPRERPAERQAEADAAHAAWRDSSSDFLGILHLWNQVAELSSRSQRTRFCRQHFLHPGRIQEWLNLVDDLRSTCREHRWAVPESIGELELLDPDGFHRSLLAGVPRSIGQREEHRVFRSPAGSEFRIFPGSALADKPPKWVMAFALVETSRLWARECAALRPEWVERVAPHLCRYRYERPVWNAKRGFVEAEERVQLGQLTLRHGARVHYGRVDPVSARRIFLEDGLRPADLHIHGPAMDRYRAFLASLDRWERKLRRPGYFRDSPLLTEYLDRVVPPEIHTARDFGRWADGADWVPDIADLTPGEELDPAAYPDELGVDGVPVRVEVAFAPGEPEDGVTFVIGEEHAADLPMALLEWTIPAWQHEQVDRLIRSLDKKLRTRCAPTSRTAAEALTWMRAQGFIYTHSLTTALAAFLAAKLDCILAAPDLHPEELPGHLRSRLRIEGADGSVRYEGETAPAVRPPSPHQPLPDPTRSRFTDWPGVPFPAEETRDGQTLYPALCDGRDHVTLARFRSPDAAAEAHAGGVARLFSLRHPDVVTHLQKRFPLPMPVQLELSLCASKGDSALEDVLEGVLRRAVTAAIPFPRDREEFDTACEHARGSLFELAEQTGRQLREIFELRSAAREAMEQVPTGRLRGDLDLQDSLLWSPGWCADPECLRRYPRYLRAIPVRIERALRSPDKDADKSRRMEPALDAFAEAAHALPAEDVRAALLKLEELRLSVYAPELRPHEKMSASRFRDWLSTRTVPGL